jgi:hypothetical protein
MDPNPKTPIPNQQSTIPNPQIKKGLKFNYLIINILIINNKNNY